MSNITKYVVTDSPDDFDGPEFDRLKDAETNAIQTQRCVVEVTYEYADSELVFDFRSDDAKKADASDKDEDEESDPSESDYDPDEDRTP